MSKKVSENFADLATVYVYCSVNEVENCGLRIRCGRRWADCLQQGSRNPFGLKFIDALSLWRGESFTTSMRWSLELN